MRNNVASRLSKLNSSLRVALFLLTKRNNEMSFNATGTLCHVLPIVTGEGKNGEWKKQDIVINIPGKYPKNLSLSLWGDTIDRIESIAEGEMVDVKFDLESREHNGRWFTNVKCYFIKAVGVAAQSNQPYPDAEPATDFEYDEDDLPF